MTKKMFLRNIKCLKKFQMARLYSTHTLKSAKAIRREFLDYFINNMNHTIVRSSPVLPLNDPTVPFVNAGMNQFKGVFLSHFDPPAPRVVNSQKCIRVGGKHNDLSIVGLDSYHHTFFEMLGNWSFGDYFKEEACKLSWNLLTGPYGLDKNYLYVTYFGGDEKLGLQPDLECKEIWLSIGVPEERILPFGLRDNFWEMGITGPCGPCTEIHVDHTRQSTNQAIRVNKGYADLTELWNIVFIQYQRLPDGSIMPLEKRHVDTGMGFERLVALLQGKRSNYDTDLFEPLFSAISSYTGAPKYQGRFLEYDKDGLDAGYRILADHARMICVALADGVLPEENPKLKMVLRKAVDVSEKLFNKMGILKELTYHVVESLGDVYPEISQNINRIQKIIEFEEQRIMNVKREAGKEWNKLVSKRSELATISDPTIAGLSAAYKDLQTILGETRESKKLPVSFAYKLYDTYGLNKDTISELAQVESLMFDREAFDRKLEQIQYTSRLERATNRLKIINEDSLMLLEKKVPKTDDSSKYHYKFVNDSYEFPEVRGKLVGLVVNGNLISEKETQIVDECQLVEEATATESGNIIQVDSLIDPSAEVGLIFDKTPCYSTEGGQASDKGVVKFENVDFNINQLTKIRGYVIHSGHFVIGDSKKSELELRLGEECVISINKKHRLNVMNNHTSVHLFNAAAKRIFDIISYQRSKIFLDGSTIDFSVFGEQVDYKKIEQLEKLVNKAIAENADVNTRIVNLLELSNESDVIIDIDGAYPDTGIRIVEINSNELQSKEACHGTHVHKTGVLDEFCVVNLRVRPSKRVTVETVIGSLAKLAKQAGQEWRSKVLSLERDYKKGNVQSNLIEARVKELRSKLMDRNDRSRIPAYVRSECLGKLNDIQNDLWRRKKELSISGFESEIKSAIQTCSRPFLVHYVQPNIHLQDFPLRKITRHCPEIPVMAIAQSRGQIKAQCCVPETIANDKFNAKTWMDTVVGTLEAQVHTSDNQDQMLICDMQPKSINRTLQHQIDRAINEANKFASLHIKNTLLNNKNK